MDGDYRVQLYVQMVRSGKVVARSKNNNKNDNFAVSPALLHCAA